MQHRSLVPGHSLKLVTAAVLLALGHTAAVAQEPGGFGQQPETQQQQPGGQPGPGQQQPGAQPGPGQQPGAQPGQQQPGAQPGPGQQQETEQDFDFQDEPDAQDEPGFGQQPQQQTIDREEAERQLDELAEQHTNLSRFIEAVKTAGMGGALLGGTNYTIFAPTDEAFQQVDAEQLLQSENWEQVAAILRAHIVADDVDPERARQLGQALTLDGGAVELSEEDGQLTVDGANVVDQDFQVGNVRIYPIDQVLQSDVAERALGGDEPGFGGQQEQEQEDELGGQQQEGGFGPDR